MKRKKRATKTRVKKDPSFIRFSKLQSNYLNELINRHRREFNEAIDSVYEDLGIVEKILKAPPGTYKLREDFSGLDVLAVKSGQGKQPATPEESPPQLITKGKGSKDN